MFQMKKIICVFVCILTVFSIGIPLLYNDDHRLNAATNYSTGSKLFIGNDSYTVIDPNTMTLLKDTATDAGEVTWNDAVASLNNLAGNYGELGSKIVSNKFTLPKTSDLTLITNNDNTALINIDSINTDWWLGDASVDNRSKFVGANTNSLVTDVSIVKNVVDTNNYVCLNNQTVTEQGIKPTRTEADAIKNETFNAKYFVIRGDRDDDRLSTYSGTDCGGILIGRGNSVPRLDLKYSLDISESLLAMSSGWTYAVPVYVALTELNMDAYLSSYKQNTTIGYDKVFNIPITKGLCYNLKQPMSYYRNGALETVKSYRYEIDGKGSVITIGIKVQSIGSDQVTVTCGGHDQTAGTSSVRPLLTLNKNKLAYSSSTKPTFNSNTTLNQSVPEVNGNQSYLTLNDSDLGITLDASNSDVSGNKLTIDRSNTTVNIPVTLSGTTSGTRYVSAVGTTNNGDKYTVLGQVNGTTGTVQLDLTSLANYQTAKTLNLTLYQEVDEGTNTTYRGNGAQITLEMNAAPITAISFTPNYPSGKTSWTEGDAGINAAGAKTGTFTFTGGTSGVNNPTSGKDYQKWEIVDNAGNPTTDSNFNITNNELIAKKKISEGTYTLRIKITDNENETLIDTITITVLGHPKPTLEFNPASSTLTYGDVPTKMNNTVGTFTLKYPQGAPTSNIASIQLGSSGDEAHFNIDTSGALKVKGNDLDAGTYSVTVTGKDGNGVSFNKTVSITVAKKDQNNYQITNSANYSLQVNQEINITTTGNDSGESETYTITSGNTVAQIVGNKFKLLSSGTFTLQATVGGNTNYNSKTVTKQITVSQLPTQNPPISITSKDSMMYGDTYTPSYSGGQGSGAVSWKIENDNGTGATLSNGKVTVTGVGTFTIKVTKAGTSSYQESTATKVVTVNKRKTTVKPKDVTKTVGQVFKDNGATYNPQPVNGDSLGTLIITSKYPDNQLPGRYTDGIQASGLSNPNYEFVYQEGTLIINSNALPNNGEGYYKVSGTKGKNNWYISDVEISATGKNGYDEISNDGISFQTSPLVYSTDGSYPTDFYLRNSSNGLVAKAIRYQLKIDQTAPDVPTMTMVQINKNVIARFINALSFGNWMNQGAQITMTSTDSTSGIDYYEYTETSQKGTNTKKSTNGIVTYTNDVELTIEAKACDKAGNCSSLSNSESIMIDRKAPQITGVKDKSEYKHYYLPRFVNVKDDYSGLSYSEYKKNGVLEGTLQNNVDEKINEVGEYEVYAIDNAGNDITITFKIIPLPDIETEIDGSDESKKIIDQVIKELDDIKNKIDETEKKDIEEWIKDALDKWNSLRKKVVETDDKSAKVEGQGNTSFDPSVELIVDDITDESNNIPPLPREPIVVYDVYLQKGNVKIQPDGSIKVYLPYADVSVSLGYAMGGANDAKPIVYQIDEKNKVKELKVQREGSFVTFITDELLRYAISDDQQNINKDDVIDKPNKEQCSLDNLDINVDTDHDGNPDMNIDIDGDGKADLNIDSDCDGIPDLNIDTNGDGKPDYNVDTDGDGEADINMGTLPKPWKPNKCVTVKKVHYCTMGNLKPTINIDTDNDGRPDLNLDIDGDRLPDLNIDVDGDRIPDVNIDTDGDGKPDINVDVDGDGVADLNLVRIKEWKPESNFTVNGFAYDTMTNLKPKYNIDTDNDGKADKNIVDNSGNRYNLSGNDSDLMNRVNTGDYTNLIMWFLLFILTILVDAYCIKKHMDHKKQNKQA